ncbi:MAG: hypothetical protein RSA27_06535, partial [Oscillospiraceae bacterium]
AYTTITYDQPMDEGSLKNVKIDGADFNSTYNGENFTQTLTFNKALEPFKTYTIFADNNVVSSNGQQLENYKQEVTPVVGKYKIQTAVKQNNTEITRGSELVGGAMINVKSVVDSSILVGNQNLNMSVMVIRDGCIENIKVAKSKIENAKSAELRMDLTLPINVENCIIKIMVMDEMFRPLTDAIEIN